jgi:phosphoribosylformimino-5-aminoimidazole carboxamide ribotide isomerase
MVDLYPAIDLRGGRVVRLVQGDYDQETAYDDDPVSVAQSFAKAGAPWIHVVDLDAARLGTPTQRGIVAAIAHAVDVPVQTGGGVRSGVDVDELLALGVARVVMGTVAVEDPELVRHLARRHPGAIAVGLDQRDGKVALRGWEQGTSLSVLDAWAPYRGEPIGALIVTDIGVDGLLEGPDLAAYRTLIEAVDVPVIASGGVGSLEHLRTLTEIGAEGVIVGKALYERRFTVTEALVAVGAFEEMP